MSEFSLIDRYCYNIGAKHADTRLSVGDDAALLAVPEGYELAVSVDTMVIGVHFLPEVAPAKLAHKLLAVNASDMGAMGARPKWATLALTIPDAQQEWLAEFSQSLDQTAERFGIELIGGDTCAGPLTLSLQIMGLVESGKALKRSGAQVGDRIYITGNLGDAALALALTKANQKPLPDSVSKALDAPEPPLEFAAQLLGLANAAIDVSDGLVADASHIAKASEVSLVLDIEQLPISTELSGHQQSQNYALYGGDDYQLCFTAPPKEDARLGLLAEQCGIKLTGIGVVQEYNQAPVLLRHNQELVLPDAQSGFDHFGNNE